MSRDTPSSPALPLGGSLTPGGAARRLAPAAIGLLPAPLLGFEAGYFGSAWGWTTLALLWLAAVGTVALERRPVAAVAMLLPGLLLAYTLALAASALWSDNVGRALTEVERALVYVAGALAVVALVRTRAAAVTLTGAVLAGTVCLSLYGLVTRLFPERTDVFDPIATYRLAEPLGYSNALGLVAATGLLLALGLADRGPLLRRAAAAATAPPLAATLYFTFSRGAWVALILGAAAYFTVGRERLRAAGTLLLAGGPAAAAVALAAREPALTRIDAALADAVAAGRKVALVLLGLVVAAVALQALRAPLEGRLRLSAVGRRVLGALLLVTLAATLSLAAGRIGTPAEAWRTFSAATPPATGPGLNARLLTLNGSGRAQFWTAALDDAAAHPWLGSGAGTYELWWNQQRDTNFKIRDAHSLYLEALAELGPAGLLLIVAATGLPLVFGVRAARSRPALTGAYAAFVAWVAHTGIDWDWEMPVLTLPALMLGAGLLASAPAHGRGGWRVHAALIAVSLALTPPVFVGLVGQSALAASERAAARGDWVEAREQASKAGSWLPWSANAKRQLGAAQLGGGDVAMARATFRRALQLDPQNWELWVDLARASVGAGRTRALAQASRLNPLSIEIATLRAELGIESPIMVGG